MPFQRLFRVCGSAFCSCVLAALMAFQPFTANAQIAPPGAAATTGVRTDPAGTPFIDYFLPTPIVGSLTKEAWGAPNVLPRDPQNGLEDQSIKRWCYWDGQIIKGPDGKYHMFASRWDQAKGHNGWSSSVAIHAVSDNVIGPYADKGLCWPDDMAGKGHNVTALVMPDGTYVIIVSETRPATVFTLRSHSMARGQKLGEIKVDQAKWRASNYSVMVRPDGDFEIVPRSGQILLSRDGDSGTLQSHGTIGLPEGYPQPRRPGRVLFRWPLSHRRKFVEHAAALPPYVHRWS